MATTDPVIKLVQGTDELDLMAGVYIVKTGFVPPEYALRPVTSGTKLVDIDDSQPRRWGFEAGVRLTTETEGRIAARKIINFLRRAGDDNNPLFLAFHPNSDVGFEPLWGQMGGYIYYPIIHGAASLGELYGGSDLRGKGFFLPVDLLLHPYALGLRQRVASATGGIITCQKEGRTNGVILEKAITNVHTNPILGHATYDNNWTAEASLIISKITDKSFVRFGVAAIKIISSGATTNIFTQTLTLAAVMHTAIYYVKLPDGRAVTTAEVEITYNGIDQTTTFVVDPERSDGWYIATAEFTGTGGAATLGVKVNLGYTAYFGMFDCAAVDYSHYPVHGNMLGCSWSGTPHASTSTRVVARIRQPVGDIFDRGQGTIVIAFRAEDDASPDRLTRDLFEIDTLGVRLRYANPLWTFTDGINTATSNGENGCNSYVEGSINIIHCTYGPVNGIAQYFNGVAMGTDATFTPGSTGTYLYIGSNSSVANQAGDEILLFETYSQPMDSATVAAHYTNILSALEDGDKIGDVPSLWVKDGDNVADNTTDSNQDNFAVFTGIPGSMPAITDIIGLMSPTAKSYILYLSLLKLEEFQSIADLTYGENQGTVDANSSEGEYGSDTVSTTGGAVATGIQLDSIEKLAALQSKERKDDRVHLYARINDQGSNLTIGVMFREQGTGNQYLAKAYRALFEGTGGFRGALVGGFNIPERVLSNDDITYNNQVFLAAKRTSTSGTLRTDFIQLLPSPIVCIEWQEDYARFDFSTARATVRTYNAATSEPATVTGDPAAMALEPGVFNVLINNMTNTSYSHLITDTLDYEEVYVTPRYSLI